MVTVLALQVGLNLGQVAKEYKPDTQVTFERVFDGMVQASTTFQFTSWAHYMTGTSFVLDTTLALAPT